MIDYIVINTFYNEHYLDVLEILEKFEIKQIDETSYEVTYKVKRYGESKCYYSTEFTSDEILKDLKNSLVSKLRGNHFGDYIIFKIDTRWR